MNNQSDRFLGTWSLLFIIIFTVRTTLHNKFENALRWSREPWWLVPFTSSRCSFVAPELLVVWSGAMVTHFKSSVISYHRCLLFLKVKMNYSLVAKAKGRRPPGDAQALPGINMVVHNLAKIVTLGRDRLTWCGGGHHICQTSGRWVREASQGCEVRHQGVKMQSSIFEASTQEQQWWKLMYLPDVSILRGCWPLAANQVSQLSSFQFARKGLRRV